MQVHFIGLNDPLAQKLAEALLLKACQVTYSHTESVPAIASLGEKLLFETESLSADVSYILGGTQEDLTTTIKQIKDIGASLYTHTEWLYEYLRLKSRVLITGYTDTHGIAAMLSHLFTYIEADIALLSSQGTPTIAEDFEDFQVVQSDFNTSESPLGNYHPNIVVVTSFDERLEEFISEITLGGILIYNQDDKELSECIDNSTIQVRKLGYSLPKYTSNGEESYIETDEGALPLKTTCISVLYDFEAVNTLVRHLGIDPIDFYEAIVSF